MKKIAEDIHIAGKRENGVKSGKKESAMLTAKAEKITKVKSADGATTSPAGPPQIACAPAKIAVAASATRQDKHERKEEKVADTKSDLEVSEGVMFWAATCLDVVFSSGTTLFLPLLSPFFSFFLFFFCVLYFRKGKNILLIIITFPILFSDTPTLCRHDS